MAERLQSGVWLLGVGRFTPIAANAYLVDDGAVTLVDTGLRWNLPTLRAELSAAGYGFADVDRVLLTHYDLDHTGGLSRLEDRSVPVYLGEQDAALVAGERLPSPFHHKGAFHRIARRLFPIPADLDVHRVADDQRIGSFVAHHAPGHNPGHTVYVHDDGAAFLGDLVWSADGRLDTPFWLDSYDMHQLRESVRTLAERLTFSVACPGHGPPLHDGAALADLAARMGTTARA